MLYVAHGYGNDRNKNNFFVKFCFITRMESLSKFLLSHEAQLVGSLKHAKAQTLEELGLT